MERLLLLPFSFPAEAPVQQTISFRLNGKAIEVTTDEDRLLFDVLREDLHLTGTKYGCGEGECGACTVLSDDDAIRSCITTIGELSGADITTIEGLGDGDNLHVVQEAKEAMQCGYCVPGQILTAVALLRAKPQATREEIIEGMNGNICRCCSYANICAAVMEVASHD
jgi:aerobic-type carbon monoxide dehydrogenase small subunit (CoxS/CutS family)